MADDWKVGDLALCVNDTPTPFYGVCLVHKGRLYTVKAVGQILPNTLLGEGLSLHLEEEEGISGLGFSAARFRKITPDKADEFDREVIEQGYGKLVKATQDNVWIGIDYSSGRDETVEFEAQRLPDGTWRITPC